MLNEAVFNEFLGDIGATVTWRKASECPCRNSRNGGADPDCPVCEGMRYVWDAGVVTKIGVQALQTQRKFAAFGEWEKGDMLATIPSDSPAYAVGEYDRFVIEKAELRLSSILTKGLNDRLKYATIKSLDRVWSIQGTVAVDYYAGKDFALSGNAIVWSPSATLPDGTQYTVRYFAVPEYFVYLTLPQDRMQSDLDLPKKVPLRLMELFHQVVT